MMASRGAELPTSKYDRSLPALRAAASQQTQERASLVWQLRGEGLSAASIAARTGLTLRQISYVEREKKGALNSQPNKEHHHE